MFFIKLYLMMASALNLEVEQQDKLLCRSKEVIAEQAEQLRKLSDALHLSSEDFDLLIDKKYREAKAIDLLTTILKPNLFY